MGTVFIPDSLGYLIGTNFFGSLSYALGQWRVAVLATLLVGISAIMVSTVSVRDNNNEKKNIPIVSRTTVGSGELLV